ncbi:RhoGAP-domain-containing protein [Basidiobolus meristosporus CBS 931.73]|uniref:RhoGAP-domain-containing protein n=1 Tax=Basidiobolus meristosporus CBS 931.73 TaxID=1314790 RepID=A0A1Y1Z6K2_9FUNG|nr:RhoGAP-domain-containing protein [Basidiobolus meristosporus CBS 931.73]|eukprot:ORY05870.1 RhoGAP-domain-containing protein [Basidiobolus meristosporus CBS 931.73]
MHTNSDPDYFNLPFEPQSSPKSADTPQAICQGVDGKAPRDLVAAINQCIFNLFSPIPLHDWVYALSDLELQTIDPLAWHPKKKPAPVTDDEVIFSDIYIAIEHCRHSIASSSNSQASSTLFSTVPSSIVALFRIHEAIKVWVISEIASLTIDYKLRISRIEKFIEMILICRYEMSALGPGRIKTFSQLGVSGDLGGKQKLYVPSFVESAIIAGLISPESRAFTKAWNDVSQNHNCGLDTLHSLINGFDISLASGSPFSSQFQDSSTTEPLGLVPSLGWMIESILEIFYYLPDLLFTSGHLINFDKRLHIYYLISSFREWTSQCSLSQSPNQDVDMSFLISQSGYATKPDIRQVKEFAARENALIRFNSNGSANGNSWSSSHHSMPIRKVFAKLIHEEQEKFKRDTRERERLEREAREYQLNVQRKMHEEAKIIEKRSSAKSPVAEPVASYFSTTPDSMSTRNRDSEIPRTSSLPSFLSKAPTVKPSLAINLIDSTISVEHSHAKRDHVFKVESEEGCQYYLQAIDRQDMMDWVQAISDAAKEAAARRITVLVEDAQKEIIEQERASNRVSATGAGAGDGKSKIETELSSVFGVNLEKMMKNTDGSDGYTVPILVSKCLSEVESRGLCEVGIYRLSGMMSSIERLRQEFNRNAEAVDLSDEEWSDINIVSGLLKQWLRELPEPLLSFELYEDFISAVGVVDYDERLFAIKDLVHALPTPNYVLLKRLVEHLEMITDYEDINHMYASNLAIVFGPTILRPPPGPASFATSMANLGQQQSIVKNLILQYHWIFDVEADVEQESEKAAYMETLTEEAEEYEYEEHVATAR